MVGRNFVYFGFQSCTNTPNRFFGNALFLQVKFRKMAFLARSSHFMFLELCSFNINGRKEFCLFWVFQNCTTTPNRILFIFLATPYALFLQVKFRKMAFLARSSHFMFLELFWISKLYDHAQQIFWQRPIFTGEIPKNGLFDPPFNINVPSI